MRKMYVIFVILLAKTIVSAGDSSDETKYIDLLPDKEKEEFLERIARRLFNGVQSKDDRDAVSGEVSDAELDENEEYVKQILKEESLNMRKNGVGVDSEKTDINREQLKEDDNVKDEYSNKKNVKEADDAGLVDLTFRDSKRNKRNSLAKINEDSKIINLNVGNGGPGEENDSLNAPLATDEDKSDVKDIQIKGFRRNPSNAIEVSTGNSQVTKMIDFDPEIENKHSEEAVQDNSKVLVKTPESNEDESPKDITQSQEPEELPNEKESNEYKKFGSTQKIFESLENNDSKDLEKKDTVLDANTTTSEPTNPEVKVPVETITEKALDGNYSSEGQQNINPNAHTRKLYTVDVDAENKKPEIKDILKENTQNYSQETRGTLVSVAIVNDLATQTNFNKETPAINLEKVNLEMTTTETMTLSNFTNTEHITEKSEDFVTTTLKTEGLTVTPLRTDEKLYEENELKDLKEEKITNLEPHTKETDNLKETSLKELIGANLNKNVPKNVDNKKNDVNSNENKEKDVNQVKVDKEVYDLTNDMIKALRTEIRPETDSQENNLRVLRALYKATKPNEYKVYAVPEGKQPFVQKKQETGNKENPYYVPIYNYSPDHAYYNPNNRLGPNADDADENIVENISENEGEDIDLHGKDRDEDDNRKPLGSDKLVRASDRARDKDLDDLVRGYNNYKKTRKFRFGDGKKTIDKVKPYKLNLPVVVQYPKFTDIILNSNDYSDIDYFYGRSLNKPIKRMRCDLDKKNSNVFPSSSEEDHPYNNMHAEHNLKDHMRAVRQLLYRQKYFGYIPELNTTESVESKEASNETKDVLRSKPSKTKPSDQTSKENIAMDYFFGRMNADVDKESRVEKLDSKHTLSTEYYQDRTKAVDNKYKNQNGNNNKYSYEILYQRDLLRKDNKHKNSLKDKENKKNHEFLYNKDKTLNNVPITSSLNYNANKNERIRVPNRYKNMDNEIKPAATYKDVSKDGEKRLLRAKDAKKPLIDFTTIKEVLSIADVSDLLPTLDKLIKVNLTTRTNDDVNLEPFLTVLEDMMKNDAKPLKQYDWLQTTVDIQAALVKLLDMTNELRNNITISQPDLQLLKYTIYLHKSAKAAQVKDFRKKKLLLPRNKKQKKGIITQSGLLDRQWLYRMLPVNHDKVITNGDLKEFHEFLNDLQYYLYDLHTAVQHIADITQFNTQRWFQNLKELYLDTKVKSLLEVLLHLSTTRLLDLVEESAQKGVEDDFLTYVMKNEKEVKRSKEEFSFVLKLIEELRF